MTWAGCLTASGVQECSACRSAVQRLPADVIQTGDCEIGTIQGGLKQWVPIFVVTQASCVSSSATPRIRQSLTSAHLQAWDAWQALGGWISQNKPDFGPGVKERFENSARTTAEQACAALQCVLSAADWGLIRAQTCRMQTAGRSGKLCAHTCRPCLGTAARWSCPLRWGLRLS